LDALRHNVASIRQRIGPQTKLMAVVKADAYGHGLSQVAATLMQCDVDAFAVANLGEALELRRLGGRGWPVLLFGSALSFELPKLVEQGIAVLGMKSMGDGNLLESGVVTPLECLHYALNLPTSVVITGIDSMEILDQAYEAVRTFRPMSDEEVRSLLSKTAVAAARGDFEPFKTTSIFDGTAQNPEWLGEEPQHLQQLMPK